MPSILSDEDKDIVKRFVPKQSNKIQAVAVARLYVALPSDRSKWTYTGLQGAIVLANDLVGNTYWLKLVDISPSARGVIWDQELFDTWNYNQDRTFFHTFELEDCLAGLSFVEEKEARTFKKKMDERENNASRATRSTSFGGGSQPVPKHGLLGGFFSRHSSAPSPPQPAQVSHLAYPNHPPSPPSVNGNHVPSEFALLDAFNPLWREHFGQDLAKNGLKDDFIRVNQEFIIEFLREEQARIESQMASQRPPATNGHEPKPIRAPPPPPPAAPAAPPSTSSVARRAVPPPPPPAPRRSGKMEQPPPPPQGGAEDEGEEKPPHQPSPPRPRFSAPPPLPEAGKFANLNKAKAAPMAHPGPPPPPRPAKMPIEPDQRQSHKFGVPPSFTGQRMPPPPPPRSGDSPSELSAHAPTAPPLPPKGPAGNVAPPLPPSSSRPVLPPPGSCGVVLPPPPLPPPLPSSNAPLPPPLLPAEAPAPPPLPSSSAPPPPPLPSSNASPAPPPPPPLPSSNAPPAPPPPPPPPPNRDSGYASGVPAPALTGVDQGRSAMLGDIQKAGGMGALKKVDRSQIRDRSAAQVGASQDTGPHGRGLPPAGIASGAASGGMADALAVALQKRKEKVSKSDDEDDDDDW